MAFQDNFWKRSGRDKIRPNPEAPQMHEGPGEFDMDMKTGSDSPKLGSSQPRVQGNKSSELPLRHANVKPRRQQKQVLMAHALRMHTGGNRMADDGTTMGTAVGGGAAGGGAGGGT